MLKLSEGVKGISYIIRSLPSDVELSLILRSLGFLLNDEVEIIGKTPFHGPMAILHHGQTFLALRYEIAQKIVIEPKK